MSLLENLAKSEFTRRYFLSLSALPFALPPSFALAQSITSTGLQCSNPLSQLKTGEIASSDYFVKVAKCVPEAVEAEKNGMLKGILFNPTRQELVAILQDSLGQIVKDPDEINAWVKANIKEYESTATSGIGRVMPVHFQELGMRIPFYIAIPSSILSNPTIKVEGDIKSGIRHEVKHIIDFYNGITLAGRMVTYKDVKSGKMRAEFVVHLNEYRAVYAELESVIKDYASTGRLPISDPYFGAAILLYSKHQFYLRNNRKSGMEQEFADAQLEQGRGVTALGMGKSLMLNVDLPGIKKKFTASW